MVVAMKEQGLKLVVSVVDNQDFRKWETRRNLKKKAGLRNCGCLLHLNDSSGLWRDTLKIICGMYNHTEYLVNHSYTERLSKYEKFILIVSSVMWEWYFGIEVEGHQKCVNDENHVQCTLEIWSYWARG